MTELVAASITAALIVPMIYFLFRRSFTTAVDLFDAVAK